MAFRLPQFPMSAALWSSAAGTPPFLPAPRVTTPCQLRLLKTAIVDGANQHPGTNNVLLLVPPHTDVRMADGAGNAGDWAEVPQGSGRFYTVDAVEDCAKAFTNEYRVAVLRSRNDLLGTWPTPYA